MKAYLFRFDYEGWCQGAERMRGELRLVYSTTLESATRSLICVFKDKNTPIYEDTIKSLTIN